MAALHCFNWLVKVLLLSFAFALPFPAGAQGMAGGSCLMCGSMGWAGMILGGLVILGLLAVLFSLAWFLIRKGRSSGPYSASR